MSKMWLIGGTAVVAALAAGAVVMALFAGQGGTDLLPADSPEGTVQRYLLALKDDHYGEAHGYLSSYVQRRCSVEEFAVRDHWPYTDDDQEIALEKTQTFDSTAIVTATVTVFHADGVPFGTSEYSYDRTFSLTLEKGQWRLTVPHEYWAGPYCPWF